MRRVVVAAWLLMGLLAASAAADIRIDDTPPRASPVVAAPPPGPPLVDQGDAKKGGCGAARQADLEWMFGLGALALGVWGLRRQPPRRAVEG